MAAIDAGVPLRDVQEAASHSDPRTTMRYDRGRGSLDRHPTYIVSTFVAGASRSPLSERQGEAHVRVVLGRLGFVGFGKHTPAELDRWTIRRMHQPLHRLAPRRTEIGEHRFDEQPGQPGALLIAAHRSHHQIAMVVPHPAITSREPLVRSDPDDVTVPHGHDHLAILVFSVRI